LIAEISSQRNLIRVKKTQGSETSQYLKEKKSTEILRVVASETRF